MAIVRLPQFDAAIETRKGQSILDAALKAGLDYPYACRSGTCSACKSRVIEGAVDHRSFDPSALSQDELESGLILACRACPRMDCVVECLGDEGDIFEKQCVVTQVRRVTSDIAIIQARTCDHSPMEFSAGQFATVAFSQLPPREYSFANRPGSDEVEFHVRAREGGLVSRYIYEHARVGETFSVRAPFGDAYLRKEHPGPLTVVVGGTGLAPGKSIVSEAIEVLPSRTIRLFFVVRRESDLYDLSFFQSLQQENSNFSFYPIVTRPEGARRRVVSVFDVVDREVGDLAGHKIYTCGSPSLVDACREFVQRRGVSSHDCHADPFIIAQGTEFAAE